MSDIKVGDKNKMAWPFYTYESFGSSRYEPDILRRWASGCVVWYEQYDQYSGERFFACNAEGKLTYEVLAVVKMPGKYQDRIIVRDEKIDPDGNIYGKSTVKTFTKNMYLKHINSHSPFNADYEIDEGLRYGEIHKAKSKSTSF